MNRAITLSIGTLLFAALSGCIAVHDGNGFHRDEDSCSVSCAKGGSAKVTCERPKVPACHCEPEIAAACVTARNRGPSFL